MPDCSETLRELEQFLDDELGPDERSEIMVHLEGCVDCHQAFEFHEELRIVVAKVCLDDSMPEGLLSRLEQCLQTDLDGDGRIG
jgi:mycothiol system anti-sigma-R factor